MLNKAFYVLGLFFILVLATTFVFANDQLTRAKGEVAGVDLENQTILVTTEEGFLNLRIDGLTNMTRDKQPVFLTDLQIGEKIDVRYDEATMTAASIKYYQPVLEGFITGLTRDDTFPRPMITVTPTKAKPVTFSVSPKTQIKRNARPCLWKDLRIGDYARVTYEPKTMSAIAIGAWSFRWETDAGISMVRGFITDLKWGPKVTAPLEMTVQSILGKAMIFVVNGQTAIDINGRAAGPKELLIGDLVEVQFSGNNFALKVSVKRTQPPITMSCILEEIKFTGSSLIFVMESVTRGYTYYELAVTPNSKLMRNGRPADASEFRVGDYGTVRFYLSDLKIISFNAKGER